LISSTISTAAEAVLSIFGSTIFLFFFFPSSAGDLLFSLMFEVAFLDLSSPFFPLTSCGTTGSTFFFF